MRVVAILYALLTAVMPGAVAGAPLDAPAAATRDEAKPMGPIAVHVRVTAPPSLGVPLSVIVTARAETLDRLDLEVRAEAAALVIADKSAPVDRAGARSWTVTVVPVQAAGGNLSVVVTGEIDGVPQAQSVVTPIRPPGAVPIARALSAGPAAAGGENLSLLPVEERF